MEFMPIFQRMVELFIIILVGYIIARLKIMNTDGKKSLSKLVLNVTMPCTILSSVLASDNLPEADRILQLLCIAFLSYIPLWILGIITPKLLGLKGSKHGIASFAILFGNVGFIGYPVTQAIYGNEALFYTSVFNMPFNLLCYSLGVYMLKKHNDTGEDVRFQFHLKNLITPALIASLLAILIALTKIRLPEVVCSPISLIGAITTPAALMIIGITLSEMKFREMFQSAKAYLFTIICVIISPLVTYLLFAPFTSGLTLRIAVILAAMPVATSGTMLCLEYKCDEKFMAQITFLTTLFTIITIPAIAVIMEKAEILFPL